MTERPPVPPPEELDPAIDTWKAGRPIVRVYRRHWGVNGFNPTATSGRFRPIRDARGKIIPTAYGGADKETALAEGLLRGVDALRNGHRRHLYRHEVEGLEMATLIPRVNLPLARLHGAGLERLRLLREHVIDCDESAYPYTSEWAQAFYDCATRLVGISWTSRQNDSSQALVLWDGPLKPRRHLEPSGSAIRLDEEPGLDLVRQACAYALIDFEG